MLLTFVALSVLLILIVRQASRISELEARAAAAAAEQEALGRKVEALMKMRTATMAPSAAARPQKPAPPVTAPPPVNMPAAVPLPVPPVEVARVDAPLLVTTVESEPAAPETAPRFDWEELIGVRLFSWAAGILLALAAVYFLGYSIQKGWLQPPVRMAIGVVVGLGLLAGCELKAARRYPVTANALDGSAIPRASCRWRPPSS